MTSLLQFLKLPQLFHFLKSRPSWILPAIVVVGLWSGSAQAQSDAEVSALVEALRLAAPDTGIEDDGLYTDWQIQADTLSVWSKFCKQPEEFVEAIVTCVVADLLTEEYGASGDDLEEAVQRSASWWMTGDSTAYLADETIAEYTQRVLEFFYAELD
jgi:hypothetical protein